MYKRQAYFQGVMTERLVGIKCKIWVDDVFFYADTENELLDTIDEILARLKSGIVYGYSQVYLFLP